VAYFHVGGGCFSGSDAVDPVAEVVVRFVETGFVVAGRRLADLVGPGFAFVSVDEDFAFFADEEGATSGSFVVEFDECAVGVAEDHVAVFVIAFGPDFGRACVVGAEGPLDDVESVGAPSGHFAAGIDAV